VFNVPDPLVSWLEAICTVYNVPGPIARHYAICTQILGFASAIAVRQRHNVLFMASSHRVCRRILHSAGQVLTCAQALVSLTLPVVQTNQVAVNPAEVKKLEKVLEKAFGRPHV
jgi:hypothetical protein